MLLYYNIGMTDSESSELKQALRLVKDQAAAIEKLSAQNKELAAIIENLKTHIGWLERQLFGAKSEKLVPPQDNTPMLPGLETAEQDPGRRAARDGACRGSRAEKTREIRLG